MRLGSVAVFTYMGVTEEKFAKETQRSRRAAVEFAIEICVASCCFLLVLLVSYGIGLVVEWLHMTEMSPLKIFGLKMAAYALTLADIYLFLVFLYRSVVRAKKRL